MNQKHQNVPIWEKANLTLEEAAAFTNIGINKLRQLTDEDEMCIRDRGYTDCFANMLINRNILSIRTGNRIC